MLLAVENIDTTLTNDYGQTALELSSEYNRTELVQMLEEHAAKSDKKA